MGCQLKRQLRVGGVRYCQRHIIQHDVEPRRSPHEVVSDQPADVLTLSDQLTGIELRHDALEHLVDDRRQDPLVVVCSKRPVDLRQSLDPRPRQHTAGDVDHLQVFCSGKGGDIPRLGAHIVCDGRLEPGDLEVGSFAVDFLLDAA